MTNLEFTLKIKTSDDAVQNGNAQDELIRMLENVIERIRAGKTYGGINDFNGNVVGTFDLEIEIEKDEEETNEETEDAGEEEDETEEEFNRRIERVMAETLQNSL